MGEINLLMLACRMQTTEGHLAYDSNKKNLSRGLKVSNRRKKVINA